MSKTFTEILGESVNLSEEARSSIQALWESKLVEAREELSAMLREEFAAKFEHDKKVMAETVDRFITDKLTAELNEFAEDKRAVVAERIQYKKAIAEHSALLNKFVTEALAKEMKELREDRVAMSEGVQKLEEFVLQKLSEEIHEFHADKKALVEQKVRMVAAGKKALAEAKANFIKRAAALTETTINKALRKELTQLREDIQVARENEFGRKMFEAYAAEYMTSYLNEGSEVAKLSRMLESKESEVKKLREGVQNTTALVESMNVKLKATQDMVARQRVMTELLAPLSKDKRAVMQDLLESVKTQDLNGAFKKYLPSVLNESASTSTQTRLVESKQKIVTGNKQSRSTEVDDEISVIKALAGIKK